METAAEATTLANEVQNTNQVRQELVIGLVGLVGTDLLAVVNELTSAFKVAEHVVNYIDISSGVFPVLFPELNGKNFASEFDRINSLMNYGNKARNSFGDYSILALGAIDEIIKKREVDKDTLDRKPLNKTIHIIKSLKHPNEVWSSPEKVDTQLS